MRVYRHHLIISGSKISSALEQLNTVAPDAVLFVVDDTDKLLGSLTDGDVRRGMLKGATIHSSVDDIIEPNPRYVLKGENNLSTVIEFRDANYRVVPVVDAQLKIVNIINFRLTKSYLPIDAVIMAGGRGARLRPLTDTTPKPLLRVGNKPIMEHNLDRLSLFGIDDFWVAVRYLGDQIEGYFGKGQHKNINISYVREDVPLGTVGAVARIENFTHDYILVTNSDLLTNVDYEQFFLEFINSEADLAVLTIPYHVSIPYAVLETNDSVVTSLKEKPSYTYQCNGGVYLMKRAMLKYIPHNTFYDAPDLVTELTRRGHKVISYLFSGYWLDVGKHEDFERAQVDLKHLEL
jgi:dTDP-glucose pyrophosphorylase/mRNA-degrading endonuclease RelE of RelBE toxin-antitoxin system